MNLLEMQERLSKQSGHAVVHVRALTSDRFKEIIKVVKETSQSTKEAMQTLCKI
jgi:hypothetical protein